MSRRTFTRFLPADSWSGAGQKVEEATQKGAGGCGDRGWNGLQIFYGRKVEKSRLLVGFEEQEAREKWPPSL